MKALNKWILWGVLALFTIILFEGGLSYFGNHSYYGSMLTAKNFGLLIASFGAAALPLYYLYDQKAPKFWALIWRIAGGIGIFMLLHEIISGTLVSFFAPVILLRNTTLLLGVGLLILFAMFSIGSRIVRISKLFSQTGLRETLLSFGVGLVVFLVLMQILMGFGLFYWPILWIILIAAIALARFEKSQLNIHLQNLNQLLAALHTHIHKKNTWIWIVLLGASLSYFYFGFNHTIIPYPTARDANHEYLYTPKVIADNFGIIRGNKGTANAMPFLWHGLIASAFSFWKPITAITSLSTDTFAINMNFWSGILVLIYGIALIIETLTFFARKEDQKSDFSLSAFFVARGLLLAWLTSGMGAFLLFVDNKTDMGVLALSIMAIFAGFSFINLFYSKNQEHTNSSKNLIYLLISAAFFGFSVMAKPTAFIDLVVFGLVMIGLCLNSTSAIGTGIITIGVMGIVQPLYASAFINSTLGIIIIAIGALILLIGIIRGLLNKKPEFIARIKNICIWWVAFLATILIFKGPRLAYQKIVNQDHNWTSFPKTLILGYQPSLPNNKKDQKSDFRPQLLATLETPAQLASQNQTDHQILDQNSAHLSLAQCKQTEFGDQELTSDLQTAPGSTLREDFGRYVGFNARTFSRSGTAGLLLKLLFWKDNTCYGFNKDAVLLCQNRDKLTTASLGNLTTLSKLFENRPWKVKNLIESGFNLSWATTLDTVFSDLSTYYQEHSILTTPQGVNIPYRYLVPINAVFNWSLQNLSSYYTDIGLVWIFSLIALIWALLSSVTQLNKKLIFFISAVGCGRIIRWAIAAGIIWYGLGLMIWLLLAVAIFFQDINDNPTNSKATRELSSRILGFLVFLLATQLTLNFLRIASQAGTWPFGRYKASAGQEQKLTNGGASAPTTTYGFNADSVFNLQFSQYSPLIQELKDRKDEDWVLIAGTYIQYFLHNQKNITLDGLLSHLREQMSDYNSCKTYHRLKKDNIKYLVIDPNIWTVGRVGAGNESLFHRFFAKLDAQEKQIQTHGAMTMLARFAQDGYLKLFFTNNIGAKYAFSLTNEELKSEFWSLSSSGSQTQNLSDDDLILIRAKLAVAKFFITQQDTSLLEHISHIFVKRMLNLSSPEGLDDLATILNKKINAQELLTKIASLSSGQSDLSTLSDDEKLVLSQYLAVLQTINQQENNENLGISLQNIFAKGIQESIFGNSQIISLEML